MVEYISEIRYLDIMQSLSNKYKTVDSGHFASSEINGLQTMELRELTLSTGPQEILIAAKPSITHRSRMWFSV